MPARLRSLQRDLLDSLWFTPTVIALLYAALALVLLRADAVLGLDTQGRDAWAVGGADGARGVLFAIAGTTLSVLGVVFSLTVVVLQIASAQFTPRVMRNLTGDRGTQVVLGVFLGTFTYALLVLRAVRSPGEDGGGTGFVPVAAVAVAIVLALVSIAFMIYTINHVARSVQVAVIIKRVTHDTLDLLDEPLAGETEERHDPDLAGHALPEEPGETIASEGDGYLEAIDAGALLAAAEMRGLLVRTEALVGSFLLSGAPLATVWPKGVVDDDLAEMASRGLCARPGANTSAGRRAGDSAVGRHRCPGFVAGRQRPDHGNLVHRPSRSAPRPRRQPRRVRSGDGTWRRARRAAGSILRAVDRRRLHPDPALRGGRRAGRHAPDDDSGRGSGARFRHSAGALAGACRCPAGRSAQGAQGGMRRQPGRGGSGVVPGQRYGDAVTAW